MAVCKHYTNTSLEGCPFCRAEKERVDRSESEVNVEAVVRPKIAGDSGKTDYDKIAELFNKGMTSPNELASRMWDKGYSLGYNKHLELMNKALGSQNIFVLRK